MANKNKLYVPIDYHERCLELEVSKRIAIEKKQKLTEATNRQILENYVPKKRWNDANEQSPSESGFYLVTDKDPALEYRYNVVYYDIYNGWLDEIKHWMWMELPELPKED